MNGSGGLSEGEVARLSRRLGRLAGAWDPPWDEARSEALFQALQARIAREERQRARAVQLAYLIGAAGAALVAGLGAFQLMWS